jgi:hypothetical protein
MMAVLERPAQPVRFLTDREWIRPRREDDEAQLASRSVDFVYKLPDRGMIIRVQVKGDAPPWFHSTLDALLDLLGLPPNWDSYGARPVHPAYVPAAVQLLGECMPRNLVEPTVVPTTSGGVQLEWHTFGIDLEVDLVSPHMARIAFEDATTGEAWEKDVTMNLRPLVECLNRLAEREHRGEPRFSG